MGDWDGRLPVLSFYMVQHKVASQWVDKHAVYKNEANNNEINNKAKKTNEQTKRNKQAKQ